MSSRFTHKEIAHQAGLSLATVDRVLHGRAHVSLATKDRLHAALQELEQQYAVSPLRQTRVTLDIVMQAPERFSSAVRAAFEAELPLVRPATFRARFHLAEVMREAEITALLRAIAKRGSQGVVLKVPATPAIEICLAELAARKIPVISYVTDVSVGLRLAYVGMQNRHAGATAAYLLAKMAPKRASRVLVTLSSLGFEGEEARRIGFCRALANRPKLLLADEPTGNLDPETSEQVFAALMALVRDTGLAALIATHNLDLAARMDRTVRLDKGRIAGL